MTKFKGPDDFSHRQPACTGVLITNLGTPDAPTTAAVRRYLAEFLADPRVVEAPRWLWWFALHGVILRIRPPRVARAYASIWQESGSPLMHLSRQLADKVQQECSKQFPGPVKVVLAMRYGTPSIQAGLEELRKANVQRIVLLPLYPQYSATTTATTFDAVSKELQTWRHMPELRMITHYHDHPDYIQALAQSITAARQTHGKPDKLLFSFHGLPKRYLLQGDPYYCHCQKTARLVAASLGLGDDEWFVSFQSRFGREEWLKPYADNTLKEWGADGIQHVQVISPGFAVDCLETLEELAEQNRDFFLHAGGKEYHYIPALNDQSVHAQMLVSLIAQHSKGWPETDSTVHRESDQERQARLERAQQAGANK
ncbi:MAG: ferrochelatase [Gammaproteobacteria bacterium]|nr:ferrochelatase [Gammaproteobacteria bacterium]MDH5651115.1 ferrochelatase [Gammaproteobacteria bacterium]